MSTNDSTPQPAEERFRAVLEQSPFSIQIMSPDGRIIRVNRAWEELWGVKLEQIEGYNILEDRQLVERGIMPYIRRAFDGEAVEIPPVPYNPDDTIPDVTRNAEPVRWTKAVAYPIKDSAGRVLEVVLMHEDITARVLAEERLREGEARYLSLLENANDIIYAHDLQGNYLSINRAGAEITGYTREEILGGLNIAQVVAPEHLELAKSMTERKLRDPSPTVYEVDIITRDGRRLTLEVSTRVSYADGRPAAIEGVARDVTERKRAEAEKARLAAQLEEQRRRLQAMVASVPGVVWEAWGVPDEASQRIDFVSEYVEAMLGYSVSEWLSEPNFWLKIVHPEDREQAARTAAEHFERGGTGTNRFRWVAKDGRTVWVESRSSTITDERGFPAGMRGVTMDVTERVRQEENERFLAEAGTALSASLDYETTLGTVARLAVPHFADWCAVDMSDDGGTLRRLAVAHVDPAKVEWARELQRRYPPDPSEPRGIYNVLRTGASEFYPDIPDEMLVAGARDEEHLAIMRQMGFRSAMLVAIKSRDRVLGVITFVNAESGRRHTAEDLAWAEDLARRAALAVENARLYRAEQQTRKEAERTSDRLARLQAVSSALSQALTPEQVAGAVIEQGMTSLGAHAGTVAALDEAGENLELVATRGFPAEVVEKWERFAVRSPVPIADAVREKLPVLVESFESDNWRERYPGLGPLASVTGSRALIALPLIAKGRTIGALGLSFARPQRFDEDDRAFMLALAQQCALALERARLYETEQRLRAEAEAANRIKDEFLATVSHELRTPLTAIVGWSSMLRTTKFDADSTARAIETIERNAKAQTQIIEDLLDVSRIITGKLTLNARSAELRSIIEAAVDSVRPAATTKGISLSAEVEPGVGAVWGDPARLQQVMWNLLSNGVKFTPRGGEVRVRLGRVGQHVRIVVSDTGQGVRPDFLPFVFDRFRQADQRITRQHGGLGLGLAIVRHLVELHGGTVTVESEGEGRGATFTVELPVMAAPAVEPQAERRAATLSGVVASSDPVPALTGLRVLLVDDEADARLLLTAVLEQRGAEVWTASSAAEALAALPEFHPDILVSDIGMPEEDGYTFLRKVRSLGPAEGGRVPAVALTAYAREEDRMRALLAGYQVHVAKPVNPAEFIAVVGGLAGVTSRK